MAQYGEILDDYEPELDAMYQGFADFFNNPTMIKIKDVDEFSMYMSKTYCLLSAKCRYIITFTPKDKKGLDTFESLNTIRWVSLQTRTLEDYHHLPPHAYNAKRGGILDVEINRVKTEKPASTYSCEYFPFTVTLLHTKKGPSEYQDKGTVIAALEQYNTIISLKKQASYTKTYI